MTARPFALDWVQRVPLFRTLTASQALDLAQHVELRQFKRGQCLVEQGRISRVLFVLLSGRATVLAADAKGRTVVLSTLVPGDYVGEMSLIDELPHSATVRVEATSEVMLLSRDGFLRSLSSNPAMAFVIMRGLVQRLRRANLQIGSLALLDVYGRVAQALVDQAETADGVRVIRGKVSRQGLADVLGASREMVSRVMKALEARGLIQTRPDGSVVVDAALVSVAAADRLGTAR